MGDARVKHLEVAKGRQGFSKAVPRQLKGMAIKHMRDIISKGN